jgi:hypothetical protein
MVIISIIASEGAKQRGGGGANDIAPTILEVFACMFSAFWIPLLESKKGFTMDS